MTAHQEEREPKRSEQRWTRTAPPSRDTTPDPHHVDETVPRDYHSIKGWGVDLDPRNRPMFPMELPSNVNNVRGEVRHWQVPDMKVFTSVEHPNLTPTFGTSCPPHGLSGLMREYAYKFGEGANRHWMTLVFADRVDIIEHLIGDLFRGKGDNIPREKGWSANAKYGVGKRPNYLGLAAAVVGAVAVGAVVFNAMSED